jgi:hypothetical protein
MKLMIDATIWQDDDGAISWTIDTGTAVEAAGMARIRARGRLGHDGQWDSEIDLIEDVSLALELLGARLHRLADSAAWTHTLL